MVIAIFVLRLIDEVQLADTLNCIFAIIPTYTLVTYLLHSSFFLSQILKLFTLFHIIVYFISYKYYQFSRKKFFSREFCFY